MINGSWCGADNDQMINGSQMKNTYNAFMKKHVGWMFSACFMLVFGALDGCICWRGCTEWVQADILQHPTQDRSQWIPNRKYESRIEEGLTKLNAIRPDQLVYIRKTGFPIEILNDKDFLAKNQHVKGFRNNIHVVYGVTVNGSVVYIPSWFLYHPKSRAFQPNVLAYVLSHETVHVQHWDRNNEFSRHSKWRHFFFWSQEDEAYITGATTLFRLSVLQFLIYGECLQSIIRVAHWPVVILLTWASIHFLRMLLADVKIRRERNVLTQQVA
jgi:hypothetical protein